MKYSLLLGLVVTGAWGLIRSADAQTLATGNPYSGTLFSYDAEASIAPGAGPNGPPTYVGTYLFAGNSIVDSNDCYFHLDMQADGNLVTYPGPGNAHSWWAAGTNKQCDGNFPFGCVGAVPGDNYAVMQTDGNFVVYAYSTGVAWWSTGTGGHPGDVIRQQEDGNLVVYTGELGNPGVLWSSNRFEQPPFQSTSPCTMQSTEWWVYKQCEFSVIGEWQNLNVQEPDFVACGMKCNSTAWCSGFDYNTSNGQCLGFGSGVTFQFPGSGGDGPNSPPGVASPNDICGQLEITVP